MLDPIGTLMRDRTGVTAIEYSLIAGVVSLLIIGATVLIGSDVRAFFLSVVEAL